MKFSEKIKHDMEVMWHKFGSNIMYYYFLFYHFRGIYVILFNLTCPTLIDKYIIVILGILASYLSKMAPKILSKKGEKALHQLTKSMYVSAIKSLAYNAI